MIAKQLQGTSTRWTKEDARAALDAWEASGKSLAAYAREKGLTVQRLHWWKRRLGSADASAEAISGFIPAVIRASAVATLRIGSDVALEIADPCAVPAEWAAAFASALARMSR